MNGFGWAWRRKHCRGGRVAAGPSAGDRPLQPGRCVPLYHWPDGTRLRVVGIHAGGRGFSDLRGRKLASLGIVPGSTIRLIQKRPLPVIAVGNSQFAIDTETADLVMCVPEGGAAR